MSQPGQSSWIWDPDSRQYYYYEARTDSLVFQNGNRVTRPSHIPRTSFTSAATRGPGTSSEYTANPNYVATAPQQTSSQSQSSDPHRAGATGQPAVQQAYQDRPRQSSSSVKNLTQTFTNVTLQNPPTQSGASRQHNPTPVAPRVTIQDGRRYVDAEDTTTEVRTIIQTEPRDSFTDPALLRSGIRATRQLIGTPGEEVTERLFASFRRREQARKFFTTGKVFLVLWVEPAGESNTLVTSYEPGTSLGRFGERVFSKVRRFIVIREADTYSSCLPIASYGQRGVGKPGVKKAEHSIIHTGRHPPQPLDAELPSRDENGMRPQPIRIDTDDPTDKLDVFSRLDYGKVHTIQHNIKVRSFGKVNPKSMNALRHQFGNVWNSEPDLGEPGPSRPRKDSHAPKIMQRDPKALGRQASRSATSTASAGSRGLQEPAARNRQLETASQSSGSSEDGNGEEDNVKRAEAEALKLHARKAVERLIRRGYTEAQAVRAVREETARRSKDAEQARKSEEEDSGEDSESDQESRAQSSTQSRRSGGQDRDERQRTTQTQSRSRSTTSSQTQQPSSSRVPTKGSTSTSAPVAVVVQQNQNRPSESSYQASGQMQGRSQAPERSVPESSSSRRQPQAQARSARESSSSRIEPRAPISADLSTQIQVAINRLVEMGYSPEEATRHVRDRFSRQ